MNTSKRIAAAVIIAGLSLYPLAVSGCSGTAHKGANEKVSENDEWYSLKKVTIGQKYEKDLDIDWIDSDFVGLAGDKIVYRVNGSFPYDHLKDQEYDDSLMSFEYIDIYGKDGALEKSFDVQQMIRDSGAFGKGPGTSDGNNGESSSYDATWVVEDGYEIKDNVISAMVDAYFPPKDLDTPGGEKVYRFNIDLTSGELISYEEVENGVFGYVESSYSFDGYRILKTFDFDIVKESMIYKLDVFAPDGTKSVYEIDRLIDDIKIESIPDLMYKGDGIVVFYVQYNMGDQRVYELNLENGALKEFTGDTSYFINDFYNAKYIEGTGNITVDEYGINLIDFDKEVKTQVFSFNSCNINRFETFSLSLLAMTEDTIYLDSLAYYMGGGGMDTGSFVFPTMYILTKEDVNPNAGKTILRAAISGSYDYAIGEAICIYNDTEPDYFIKLIDDYSVEGMYLSGELSWNDPDFEEKLAKAEAHLTYQLVSDLKNGEGPDLIISEGMLSVLNDKDCLVDLKREVGTDGFFENIIKASEVDGKIYQFPLSFNIEGVIANKGLVGEDQYGFTYDQYKEFVSDKCNGDDPVGYPRINYFNTCLRHFETNCIKGTKINFNNQEYKALAEFVSENVTDPLDPDLYAPREAVVYGKWAAKYDNSISLYSLMRYYADSLPSVRVLGLPSSDGQGPSVNVSASVGVSATTGEKEACVKFVKTLLSEGIQKSIAHNSGTTPVSCAAYRSTAQKAIVDYNFAYEKNLKTYGGISLRETGMAWHSIDPAFVDQYEEIIGSCTNMIMTDPGLELIVSEEMPAYFEGQKSLDEVIKLIDNRAQTLMNERD